MRIASKICRARSTSMVDMAVKSLALATARREAAGMHTYVTTRRWIAVTISIVAIARTSTAAPPKMDELVRTYLQTTAPEIRVDRDVIFGRATGEDLKLDVYRPANDQTSHPVVLMLHGGGWAGGDKMFHAYQGVPLAKRGYLAFSANYRLAPKYKYPAGVEDCQAAMRWVREHAADYGGDPTRLALLGESAGGHLSSLLGLWDWTTTGAVQGAHDGGRVRAVVNVFGPCDLADFGGIPFCQEIVKNFLGGTTETVMNLYREVSPINLVVENGPVKKPGPSFLHIHGTKDVLVPVDQSRRFDAKLKENGFDSTLLILEGANHGWKPDSADGKRSYQATFDLLEKALQ